MVKYYQEPLDFVFFALADKTRREILVLLQQGFKTATELAEPFAVSLPAISKHLKILERSNLIIRQKQGRTHYFCINREPLGEVQDWVGYFTEFWDGSLDKLENFLAEQTGDSDE